MYELSISGSLSRPSIVGVNTASPPNYQSRVKEKSKDKVDSAPPKPPQKAEERGKTKEKKLTAGSKNSQQVTNRTTHKEKAVHIVGGDGKNAESSEWLSDIPVIYGITPTYKRNTQKVDLTSLCQTLMLVPQVLWIVVEDATEKSDLIKKFLQRCQVESVHMNVKTPPGQKSRGVLQRNAGLNWIRQHCTATKCNGVIYFMDDDNKYDLRLFEEVRERERERE